MKKKTMDMVMMVMVIRLQSNQLITSQFPFLQNIKTFSHNKVSFISNVMIFV